MTKQSKVGWSNLDVDEVTHFCKILSGTINILRIRETHLEHCEDLEHQVEAYHQISQLAQETEFVSLLRKTISEARDLVRAQRCSLFLIDEKTQGSASSNNL